MYIVAIAQSIQKEVLNLYWPALMARPCTPIDLANLLAQRVTQTKEHSHTYNTHNILTPVL